MFFVLRNKPKLRLSSPFLICSEWTKISFQDSFTVQLVEFISARTILFCKSRDSRRHFICLDLIFPSEKFTQSDNQNVHFFVPVPKISQKPECPNSNQSTKSCCVCQECTNLQRIEEFKNNGSCVAFKKNWHFRIYLYYSRI